MSDLPSKSSDQQSAFSNQLEAKTYSRRQTYSGRPYNRHKATNAIVFVNDVSVGATLVVARISEPGLCGCCH